MKSVRIDIWSDVVCPFCYLGNRQLELALEAFDEGAFEIHHHAFELDPSVDARPASLDVLLAEKYGQTIEQAHANHERLSAQARSLGLDWHLDVAQPTNTRRAHRLIELARQQGRQGEMVDRLFRAYFSEGRYLDDAGTLEELAEEIGVVLSASLDDETLDAAVQRDVDRARDYGLRGVPAFVLDERFLISGAQGVDALRDALAQVLTS